MSSRALLVSVIACAELASKVASADVAPRAPDDVRVGGARRAEPVAASDVTVHVGQLGDVPRRSAEQLLTLAPGLFLSNPSGEGHASTIFLRGFDAGEGQDVEIRVEGVPVNEPSNAHAHGYADVHFVVPELVERLRVIEGPFDPRQGDFAVAGSVHYGLGLERRGLFGKVAYGSFDTRRLLVTWGPKDTTRGTFVAADHLEGNGFGPNRSHASTRAMGQLQTELGDYRLTLLANAYTARFDAAGVVRDVDVRARRLAACPDDERSQFFCFHDPNQGGVSTRHGASVRLEKTSATSAIEHQLFAVTRPLRVRQNLTGFLLDPSPEGEPQRGDGVEQRHEAVTVGGRSSYALRSDLGGLRQELEVGTFVRHDRARATQRRLRAKGGAPYRVDSDSELGITNVAFHAAATVRPLSRLALRGGLRLDTFAFSVLDRNRPTVDRDGERLGSESIDAYGVALQPRLSADVELTRPVHWVTSFGFGTRSSDAQALSQGEFAPFARVRALESGVVGRAFGPGFSANLRGVGFWTHVERDLVFDEIAARNTVIGASNRFGALAAARLSSAAGFDSQASFTWSEAHLPSRDAGVFDLADGPRLPYVPRFVGRLDASLRRPLELRGERATLNLAAGFTYVAPRPLPFGELGPAFGSLDAAVRLRIRSVEVGVEATNLLDRRNKLAVYNYASTFGGGDAFASRLSTQHFAAGPPLTVLATLAVTFDGEGS